MRNRIVGLASAAVWLVAITEPFLTFGLVTIKTTASGWALLIAATATLGLGGAATALLRRAKRLPRPVSPPTAEQLTLMRRFLTSIAIEVVAFATLNSLLAPSHADTLPALNVAIIGLHLIHLARIFDVPRYYALGLHFCAIATVTLLMIPSAEMIGHARLWYVFPSLAVAPVVWAVAVGNLREASQQLAEIE
jgi:hypothetical protein